MTGQDWLGTLPSGWQAQRADAVLDYRKTPARTTEFESAEVFHYSIPAIQETGDGIVQNGSEIDSDKIRLDGGELIVSKLNPRKGCVLLTRPQSLPIVCSTEFVPLIAKSGFSARFAYYIYSSTPVRELISAVVQSVTRSHQRANPEDITKIWLPVPPLSQQHAIAAYLDRETTRLGALVAAKEHVLGLLAEKRWALIARAVTRGLDPRGPVRDSGIPWLGKIPAHWRTARLRFLIGHLEQGWSPEAENREPSEDEWGVLKLNAVVRGRFDPSASKALPSHFPVRADLEVRSGDFLVTRSNTPAFVGDACFVSDTRPRLMLCDLIYRLSLIAERIDGRFLGHFLTLPEGRGQIETDARGTSNSMVKISQEHIKDWRVPVPPLDEQRAIVGRLDRETAKLDAMRSATERTIALLEERRAALIAAAVTGQIDVGGAGYYTDDAASQQEPEQRQ